MSDTRLVFTGFPCPAEPWLRFLPNNKTNVILPLSQVIEETDSVDFLVWSKFAQKKILELQPSSLVMHDFGLPYGLLALLRLKKKAQSPAAKVTLFNSAFRGFDVFKAPHPFRLQYLSLEKIPEGVRRSGGEWDERLNPKFPKIRELYRNVILQSISEKIMNMFTKKKSLDLDLGIPAQIIASPNDRYVPFSALKLLQTDFNIQNFHELPYGHFPYSRKDDLIRNLILDFE